MNKFVNYKEVIQTQPSILINFLPGGGEGEGEGEGRVSRGTLWLVGCKLFR